MHNHQKSQIESRRGAVHFFDVILQRIVDDIIHTLPVSAAHVQSSKNNRFCRYYVIFGRNNRSALVGKREVKQKFLDTVRRCAKA